jgi:hypothetical protein
MKPSAIRMRRLRAKRWQILIEILGGKCEVCGTTEDLQVDHLQPRDWKRCETWSDVALKKHIEEAKAGKVQLLCGFHNRQKGQPAADDGEF